MPSSQRNPSIDTVSNALQHLVAKTAVDNSAAPTRAVTGTSGETVEKQERHQNNKQATETTSTSSTEDTNTTERTAEIEKFWKELDIDVVELKLPGGTGYTLRHYRTVTVAPEDIDDVDESGDSEDRELTDEELAELMESTKEAVANKSSRQQEPEEREDVVFLAHQDQLLLFRSQKGLVEFVRSNQPNDLKGLENYRRLRKELRPEYVVAAEEDHYQLSGVVKNLREGHKAWDDDLLISASEIARDIAQACSLTTVLSSLAPGTLLDDLDENLRKGGVFARWRLRKIGVERAALAWRSVIGKITGAVEWRD